jgi:hypothetical protein
MALKLLSFLAIAGPLGVVVAPSCEAQHLAPVGVRWVDAMPAADTVPVNAAALPDSTREPINRVGGVVGGVLGGALGALAGIALGVHQSQGCSEEFCDIASGIVGFAIGEPIGVAVGTHFGARGHGNVLLSSITSFGLLVVGGVVTAGANQLAPPLGLLTAVAVLTLQIMAALAIER